MKFEEFDLKPEIKQGLKALRFEEPTPVQEKCIPLVLNGRDLVGTAQTGTGKTAAFVIPLLHKIMEKKDDGHQHGLQALIISPTRELAKQIDEQIFAIGYHCGITSATIIGGSDFGEQARAIRAGVDLLVATPGRLLDQIRVMDIDFSNLQYLVLDEADRMLDMGFLPDIKKIVYSLPKKRQTMLFSATMPDEVRELASRFLNNPETVEIATAKPADNVDQRVYHVHPKQKIPLLQHLFDELSWESAIIFTKTKKGTDELERLLKKKGMKTASMHGDRSQEERNKALQSFKNGEYPVMVATDVLARGIDIDNISIIVNYDVPQTADDYIHRIGRTGRYDKSGLAITLVTNRDKRSYSEIRKVVGDQINELDVPGELKNGSDSKGSGRNKKRSSGRGKSSRSQSSGNKNDQKSSDRKQDDNKSRPEKKDQQEDSRSKRSRRRKKKAPRKIQSEQSGDGNRKQHGRRKRGRGNRKNKKSDAANTKSNRKNGSDKKQSSKRKKPATPPPRIEKAISKNKNTRPPSKGFWGIIKSFIPKISSD